MKKGGVRERMNLKKEKTARMKPKKRLSALQIFKGEVEESM